MGMVSRCGQWIRSGFGSIAAAIMFYTRLPVPSRWCTKFDRVARYAPAVGLLIGAILAVADLGLAFLSVPTATRSAIIVLLWVSLTGGLHLDGVLDTADGLAVPPPRRLAVMADSRVGAFGAIAGASLIVLKTVALSDISQYRGALLLLVAGWGRWGQQVAIACYPYLRAEGKGAMHKQALPSFSSTLPNLGLLLLLQWGLLGSRWPLWWGAMLSGGAAWGTGAWLNWRLGGHTGDTYGAVVEWTEAIALVAFATVLAA